MVNRTVNKDLKWVANGTLTSPALSWYLYPSQAKNSVESTASNKESVGMLTSFRYVMIVYWLVSFSTFDCFSVLTGGCNYAASTEFLMHRR